MTSDDGNVEIIRVHLKKIGFEGYIIGFYSSNYLHRNTLLELLEDVIPSSSPLPCILLGDANINLLSKSASEDYVSFLLSRDLYHAVDRVTRPFSGTCLDHIILRNCEDFICISTAVWQTPLFSDHYPVILSIRGNSWYYSKTSSTEIVQMRRRHDKTSIEKFKAKVENLSWLRVYDTPDVVCF